MEDKEMELNDIMVKYQTDKRSDDHNYVQFYEQFFKDKRNEPLKILEIGIYRPRNNPKATVGASLKTWEEYFPNALIYGADIEDFSDIDGGRIKTILINQENRTENKEEVGSLESIIKKFGGDFDIIIDDGGHTMLQQQVTLGYLFPYLKSGGLFVIEDLHTSYIHPHVYNITRTKNTTLKMFQNYDGKLWSEYMTESELTYLNNNIEKLDLLKGNYAEICFIKKK